MFDEKEKADQNKFEKALNALRVDQSQNAAADIEEANSVVMEFQAWSCFSVSDQRNSGKDYTIESRRRGSGATVRAAIRECVYIEVAICNNVQLAVVDAAAFAGDGK